MNTETNNEAQEQAADQQASPAANQFDFQAIQQAALKVVMDPAGFFKGMQKTGGFVEPLIFVVTLSVIAGVVSALLSTFGFGLGGLMVGGFIAIFLVPIYTVIFSFIGAAIAFVIWKLMGSEEDYETAFRCVAYTAAIAPINALLAVIPYVGSITAALWPLALLAIASIHVHRRSTQVAWGVFGIIGLIFAFSTIAAEQAGREFTSKMDELQEVLENSRR